MLSKWWEINGVSEVFQIWSLSISQFIRIWNTSKHIKMHISQRPYSFCSMPKFRLNVRLGWLASKGPYSSFLLHIRLLSMSSVWRMCIYSFIFLVREGKKWEVKAFSQRNLRTAQKGGPVSQSTLPWQITVEGIVEPEVVPVWGWGGWAPFPEVTLIYENDSPLGKAEEVSI